MTYLLDTDVVSEARRPRPNASVLAWLSDAPLGELYLSVLVGGELRQGIARLRWRGDDRQAALLDGWLTGLERIYGDRILPVTREVADTWGQLNVPDLLPPIDGLLAVTAKVHGLTLVTRNVKDVARTGVPVLNPFDPVG
ncbi:type II toxin-antitoxin system VapC family toxin [Kitasatospora sp. CMC57]|uniref:Ribonuclease VapC n=1 Tax=Kitasatospora sp. CMC57 TaxID=3231513 RepID=A0AB33KA89_9ACTN